MADPILTWRDLGKSFGRKKLFADLAGQVDSGRIVAVLGPNGSGKSTFLKTRGNGLDIYDPDPDDLRRCIEELSDRERLAELTASTVAHRDTFPWDNTRHDYLALAAGDPVAASS